MDWLAKRAAVWDTGTNPVNGIWSSDVFPVMPFEGLAIVSRDSRICGSTTCATTLTMAGVSQRGVMAMLGHRDPRSFTRTN